MAKRIALFNHKGGVSKTTTAFNLGWKIAEMGFRVLLVDGDPQCNLTQIFFGEKFDDYYENPSTSSQNIKDGVSAAFDAKPEPIRAVNCPFHLQNSKLFILPGNPTLSDYDPSLSLAHVSANVLFSLQNLLGAFHDLIQKIETEQQIDFTIIDLNPGLSSINQNLFSISNFFILPLNPDPFSVKAILSLSNILPKWSAWSKTASTLTEKSVYPFPKVQTKFLGDIIQRFNIRNNKPATPNLAIIKQIEEVVTNTLIIALQKNDLLLDREEYADLLPGYCLAQIPDFQGLIQIAFANNKTVFSLTDIEIKNGIPGQVNYSGAVAEQYNVKRGTFDELFNDLSKKIIKMTN